MWKQGEWNEKNAGFAAYIGAKCIAWHLEERELVKLAYDAIKKQVTKNRFVPSITVFDCASILVVGFLTDDANGIAFHRRNAVASV